MNVPASSRIRAIACVALFLLAAASGRTFAGPASRPADVRDYGAVPDDERDDTAAIQKALIENRGNVFNGDVAGKTDVKGGVVFLPRGKYLVTGLELFTATTLRGEPGTLLLCTSDKPAITTRSHFGHGDVALVGVEGISITAPKSCAIRAADGPVNSFFRDLRVSSKETCLQFDVYTQNTIFHNIAVVQTGSGALRLFGNANHVDRVNTEGGPAPNYRFDPPEAMIVLKGPDGPSAATRRVNYDGSDGNAVTGCIIEGGYPCPAFSFRGEMLDYRNNWIEMDHGPTERSVLMERVEMSRFDRLGGGRTGRIQMRDCAGVTIGELWTGEDHLRAEFDLDDKTTGVIIDVVNSAHDSGGLDDPQLHVRTIFSRRGRTLIERHPFRGNTTWADRLGRDAAVPWSVRWRDGAAIEAKIVDKPDRTGHAMEFSVPEDTDEKAEKTIVVRIPVSPPARNVGSTPYAMWRVDGPAGQNMIVYVKGWKDQFATRSMNSLTAAKFPRPVEAEDELLMCFNRPRAGKYRVSDVRVGL